MDVAAGNALLPSKEDLLAVDCFFFDFDGVILESANIKTEAFVDIYKGTGIEQHVLAYHLQNQGISRFVKFKWISEHLLNMPITEAELQEKGSKFTDLVFQKILQAPFVAGVMDLLQFLKERNKYIVVASGTPHEELLQIVKARNIQGYFDELWGTPLPKTEIVKKVLHSQSFDAKRCLFIGDATTDYLAALETGLSFFARRTPEMTEYWLSKTCRYISDDFCGIV
jgi:beta-phosphoglucomutase-like phosphatase (HAD superfamily)